MDENFNFKTFTAISVMSCFVIVIYRCVEIMMGPAVFLISEFYDKFSQVK